MAERQAVWRCGRCRGVSVPEHVSFATHSQLVDLELACHESWKQLVTHPTQHSFRILAPSPSQSQQPRRIGPDYFQASQTPTKPREVRICQACLDASLANHAAQGAPSAWLLLRGVRRLYHPRMQDLIPSQSPARHGTRAVRTSLVLPLPTAAHAGPCGRGNPSRPRPDDWFCLGRLGSTRKHAGRETSPSAFLPYPRGALRCLRTACLSSHQPFSAF